MYTPENEAACMKAKGEVCPACKCKAYITHEYKHQEQWQCHTCGEYFEVVYAAVAIKKLERIF